MTNIQMILVFDLDDTLYRELSYVESGLSAVSLYLADRYVLSSHESNARLLEILNRDGRGRIFDNYLKSVGLYSVSAVNECLSIYRAHTPNIFLYKETEQVLSELNAYPHYLVTDGNKIVQQNKITALGIQNSFSRVFITHRFGVRHAKPSTYCFEKIRLAECVQWPDIVYIGDNPHKDFVNLNKKGALTIRVHTGSFGNTQAKPGYDAKYSIEHIRDLPWLLKKRLKNLH